MRPGHKGKGDQARPKSEGRQNWSFQAPPCRGNGPAKMGRGGIQKGKEGEFQASTQKERMGKAGPDPNRRGKGRPGPAKKCRRRRPGAKEGKGKTRPRRWGRPGPAKKNGIYMFQIF